MPPIEVGPARALSAINARLARAAGGEGTPGANGVAASKTASAPSVTSSASGAQVKTTTSLDPGQAPVDTDRVSVIRKAVESGSYPVIPTKIADAIIAAGVLLRSPK